MKAEFKIAMVFILYIFCITVSGQEIMPVNQKDANWSTVQAEIERITKSDPNSLTGNNIVRYGLKNTNDANSLFPGWKFYGFVYSMYVKNPADKNKVHLAMELKSTLAVLTNSNPVKTFVLYNGNSDDYGKFLKLNKILIRDAKDANLVWNSFCEIYGRSKQVKHEKTSDNEWKLGINSYDQKVSSNTTVKSTNYFKATIDPNTKQITGWKNFTETSDTSEKKSQ
jgi:hypothetical protein